jgi:hypothetical protein
MWKKWSCISYEIKMHVKNAKCWWAVSYEMCTNKYNVPGCEYQVRQSPSEGLRRTWYLMLFFQRPPTHHPVLRCNGNGVKIISFVRWLHMKLHAQLAPPWPAVRDSFGRKLTRPTHHPDLRCRVTLLKRQWAKTCHLGDVFIWNVCADRTKQKPSCYSLPTWLFLHRS